MHLKISNSNAKFTTIKYFFIYILHYLDHKIRKQFSKIKFKLFNKRRFAELNESQNIKHKMSCLSNMV